MPGSCQERRRPGVTKALDDLERHDAALCQVESSLPADFPAAVHNSVVTAMMQRLQRLEGAGAGKRQAASAVHRAHAGR